MTSDEPEATLVATILIFSDRSSRLCRSSDICPMVVDTVEALMFHHWEVEIENAERRSVDGDSPCGECTSKVTCQFKIGVDDEDE